jgi:hypothetical protein
VRRSIVDVPGAVRGARLLTQERARDIMATEEDKAQARARMERAQANLPAEQQAEIVERTKAAKAEVDVIQNILDIFGDSRQFVEAGTPVDWDSLAELSEEVMGDWELVKASSLVGVPFIIFGVNLVKTVLNKTGHYANVRCVLMDNSKVCFNDGSSGVYRQLQDIMQYRADNDLEPRPIMVKGGLRASTYHWEPIFDERGNQTGGQITDDGPPNAATFYLTNSLASAEASKVGLSALGK